MIKRPKLENEELEVVRLRIEEEEKKRKEEEEEEKMRKELKEQSFKVCEFSSSFFLFFSFCFGGRGVEGLSFFSFFLNFYLFS